MNRLLPRQWRLPSTAIAGQAHRHRPGTADITTLDTAMRGTAGIVSPSARFRRFTAGMLRRLGWSPVTAGDPQSLLARSSSEPLALVLLDLHLRDAIHALPTLRASAGDNAAIVAVATGSTPAAQVKRALARGADDFCRWPIRRSVLAARIRVVLRTRAATLQARRQAATMASVAQVGARIAAAPDLETALRALHEGAGAITGSNMGVIRLLEGELPDGQTQLRAYRRAGSGNFLWEDEWLAPGSNTAHVFTTGQPVYARDLVAEAAAGNGFARYGLERYGVRSSLNVPLRTHGRIVGALHVDSQQTEAFSDGYLDPLQVLADHAAGAVERVRLDAAARASAEEAREAAARFAGVLRAATEYAIIGMDITGDITIFNTGAERMLGYAATEVVGRVTPAAFLDSGELADRAAQLQLEPGFDVLAAQARRGRAETRQWTCFRKDHTQLIALVSVTAMRNAADELTGFIAMLRDITQEKTAQLQLRSVATSARCVIWHALVEQHNEAFIWSLHIADEAAAQHLLQIDVQPNEVYDRAWYRSKLPEDRPRMDEVANGALRSGKASYAQEFRCRRANGELFWLWEDVQITPLEPGRWRLDGVATDITTRKQVEAELNRQYREAECTRSQILAILDASVEGMALLASDGSLLMVNRRLGEFFGATPADLLGKNLHDLSLGLAGGELRRILTQTNRPSSIPGLDDEPSSFLVEQRWPERRELAVVCSTVRSPGESGQQESLGRLFVLRDVTREREIDRMKTEFVSLVSHELRTPLTSIKGYTDLLIADEVGAVTADQREFLGVIKSNADRLVSLINDLLDVSRLDEGRVELHRHALNLGKIIRDAAQSLHPMIETKRQHLTLDVAALVTPVWADYGRATQIVINLLANAQKYTPAGGSIAVRATEKEGWACVAIQDTGIGISPEEQRQLFTRFFRAKNYATEHAGGTGLGLSIVHSLVELHGGAITVESAPGEGATFTFTLPLAARAPA